MLNRFYKTYLEDASKIQSITSTKPSDEPTLWGSLAAKGLVVIYLKKEASFDPEVAGLRKVNGGNIFDDNFDQVPFVQDYTRSH